MKFSIVTLRETQRMDSIFRGPIHSTFTNIVNGLVSLRTYERIGYFKHQFIDQLEKSCNVTFTYYAINRWVSNGLDLACITFTLCVSLFTVYAKGGSLSNDFLAFTLQIITDVVVFFSISLRMCTEIENYFTSSQRVFKYTELESEDDLVKKDDETLKSWPQNG